MAWAAAEDGDAHVAGTFWGAAEAEAERGMLDPLLEDRAAYEAHLSVVAGPDFERAARRGRALSLDEAVAYALGAR